MGAAAVPPFVVELRLTLVDRETDGFQEDVCHVDAPQADPLLPPAQAQPATHGVVAAGSVPSSSCGGVGREGPASQDRVLQRRVHQRSIKTSDPTTTAMKLKARSTA